MCTRFYLEPGTKEIEDVIEVAQRSSLADKFSRAGAEMLTCHSLRHTYATRCVGSGVEAHALKELMGHTDIS